MESDAGFRERFFGRSDRGRDPPARYTSFAAVVILRGEHDMASAPAIEDALASIFGDVRADFSECTFCDSSVVRVLFDAGSARRREGQRIELLVPESNASLARSLEITGLGSRVTIHTDRLGRYRRPSRSLGHLIFSEDDVEGREIAHGNAGDHELEGAASPRR